MHCALLSNETWPRGTFSNQSNCSAAITAIDPLQLRHSIIARKLTSQEDVLVGIQAVDDEVHDSAHLGLELELLLLGLGGRLGLGGGIGHAQNGRSRSRRVGGDESRGGGGDDPSAASRGRGQVGGEGRGRGGREEGAEGGAGDLHR